MIDNKINERDIQLAIYKYRSLIQPYPVILTNIYFFNWESDALYITRNGNMWEYEIKLTHSDFLADKIKVYKHKTMREGKGPSRFYYVCPENVIKIEEVPEYAGLAYFSRIEKKYDSYNTITIVKEASRRKGDSIKDRRWREIATKATDRFWSSRLEMIRRLDLAKEKMNHVLQSQISTV